MARTTDKANETHLRFYTVEQLGEKQSLTPEGFLLCEDVAIARSGTMVYGPGESPIEVGPDGVAKVHRDIEDIHNPIYIASYAGKPVVNDHPEDDVTPETWKELTIGVVLNPRPGTGTMMDCVVADLLITTPEGIDAVRGGKVEVSCGYDADYEETQPGEGRQMNLIGNHVALVEAGRCGPRCSIKDRKSNFTGGTNMAGKIKKGGVLDRMLKAFGAKDAEELVTKLQEGEANDEEFNTETGNGDTHVHIHTSGSDSGEIPEAAGTVDEDPLAELIAKNDADHNEFRQRLEALEAKLAGGDTSTGDADEGEEGESLPDEVVDAIEEEVPTDITKDSIKKARDSAFLEDSFQTTISEAEILVPGIRIPAFDSKANPKKTYDGICKLRRSALDAAYSTQDGQAMIEQINGKPLELSGMKCNQVRTLFKSVVALKKVANASTYDRKEIVAAGKPGAVQSIAELNKRNADHYAGK